MYEMTVSLKTPNYDGDDDLVYDIHLPTKHDLNKVERTFMKALEVLVKLTEDELKSGKKAFDKTNPQTTVFEVNIEKDGADYGGYTHRWPNQSDDARAYLKALLEGMLDGAGHGAAKKVLKRNDQRA